ncbi:Carboxylic ester hydrolase, partial [Gryllus bimaculatus]
MSGFVTVSVRQGALRGRRRQTPGGHAFVVGAEDCLFLNVFTRRLPAGPAGPALAPRAVLVWIHGGGFTEGTGNGFCEAPAEALVRALDAGRSAEERRRGVVFTFLPVVEPALPGAFLATSPDRALADLLAAPRSPRVPVVFGLTSHEGILMLPAVPTPEALEQVDAHFEYAVPFDLVADRSDTARTRELTTDTVFAHAVTQTARAHARLGAPVYLFEFAYVGRLNLLGPLFGSQRVPGACHADELGYLFHVDRLPAVEPDSPEARVRRRMVRMWVDFAQSGNPTPALDEEITHKWEQFSEAEPNYLSINDELSAGKGLFKERIAFWDDLYKAEGTQKSYLASPKLGEVNDYVEDIVGDVKLKMSCFWWVLITSVCVCSEYKCAILNIKSLNKH